MGYTTDFWGEWEVTPTLRPEHRAYLEAFAQTRRMNRDASITETLPDPIRVAAGLPVGPSGCYYVGGYGQDMGQSRTPDITDYNNPPGLPSVPYTNDSSWYTNMTTVQTAAKQMGLAQPGLWCQWTPNDDGSLIVWDEGEKFYDYIEWIEYIIEHFMERWGYELNGDVSWSGEDSDDRGVIRIEKNKVSIGRPGPMVFS